MQWRGHGALDLRALRNAASREVVDLHLAAARRRPGATHHQVALGQCVDLAIGTAQRRGDEGAALERLGVAHGRHVHVQHLPRLRKRGQLGGDDDGCHVLELQLRGRARRQGDAHLLQVVGHGLRGVGHLRGLVARAVQPHHQAIAGELVAAHALHGRHFLDAQCVRCRRCRRQHCGQQEPERRRLRDQTEWDEAFMASIVVGHGKN